MALTGRLSLTRWYGGDLFTGHVGEILIHELGGVGTTFASKVAVQPLSDDGPHLSEEVVFSLFVGVAPLGVNQADGQMI